MYQISNYSGKIKHVPSGVIFPNDSSNENYPAYYAWLSDEGTPIFVDFFEGEENEKKSAEYEEIVKDKFLHLMKRALSSSMGKYGSYQYLQMQKNEYDEKYYTAKNNIFDTPVANAIEKEMLRDFSDANLTDILTGYGITPAPTNLGKMYQLIVFRYEYAENRYNIFKGLCIDFRTKCRTFIEQFNFATLDIAFNMVDNLPDELTLEKLQTFYNDFDAL